MQYEALRYVPEAEDPSIELVTERLVAKIIDNSGLTVAENPEVRSEFGRYGVNACLGYSHHLGYHGIRCLYARDERRNLVLPLASWLNLQGVRFSDIENDPVDERAWAGVARGWPLRMEAVGQGARLTLDPMPQTQFAYEVEFQPAEPDAIDFEFRFTFHRRPEAAQATFTASWPCYMNAYDDVRFFYPTSNTDGDIQWRHLGEKPNIIIGEPVGYRHEQTVYNVDGQAFPVGFGRIGERALVLMFDDPSVQFFVVNAGGHLAHSAIQNPAWDFKWTVTNYPIGEPIGFKGRLCYTKIAEPDEALARYRSWLSS